MKKRVVYLFLCLFMIVSMFPSAAGAATMSDVPKSIGAPINVGISPYEEDGVLQWFEIGFSGDSSVRKFGQMVESGEFEELGLNSCNIGVQTDYKYNETGSWHYDSSWDEWEAPLQAGCDGVMNSDSDIYTFRGDEIDPEIKTMADLNNNTLYIRIRYVLDYYNEDSGDTTVLISPWSDTVMIGKNAASTKVTSIEPPKLLKAELKKDNSGIPYFEVTVSIPDSVKTLNNGAGSVCQFTSIKKDGGSWSSETGSSAGLLQEVFTFDPEDVGGAGEINIEAANYDVRVRFGYSSVYAGDIEVYSPYSNILTIGTPGYSSRLFGANRIDTAVAVSKEGWPNGASTVILTRDDNYPDALTGAPLSRKLDAPILFTNSKTLTAATETEIARLKAGKVVILGGTSAVSQTIEEKLKLKYQVQRIGGTDRFDTAAKIARELGYKGKAVVTTGMDFHDALTVSPLAAYNGIPILLTQKDALPSSTKDALSFVAPTEITVVGSTSMVSDKVFAELANAKRITGRDIYESSVAVAKNFNADTGRIFLATGKDFPDALSGSGFAAKYDSPILFVADPLSDYVSKYLTENKGNTETIVYLLGGENAISNNVKGAVDKIFE